MINSFISSEKRLDESSFNLVKSGYEELESMYNVVDTGINILGITTGSVQAYQYFKNGGSVKSVTNVGVLGLKEAKKIAASSGRGWSVIGTKGMHPNIKTYNVFKTMSFKDIFNFQQLGQGAFENTFRFIDINRFVDYIINNPNVYPLHVPQ